MKNLKNRLDRELASFKDGLELEGAAIIAEISRQTEEEMAHIDAEHEARMEEIDEETQRRQKELRCSVARQHASMIEEFLDSDLFKKQSSRELFIFPTLDFNASVLEEFGLEEEANRLRAAGTDEDAIREVIERLRAIE